MATCVMCGKDHDTGVWVPCTPVVSIEACAARLAVWKMDPLQLISLKKEQERPR